MIKATGQTNIPGDNAISAGGTSAIGGGASGLLGTIDMTAAPLDSRLTYAGPAHIYVGQTGEWLTSAANTWPLEYVNGVAAGRADPEVAISTWQPYNRGVPVNGATVVESPASTVVVGTGLAPDGGDIASLPLTANGFAVSQDINSVFHVPIQDYGARLTDQWTRFVYSVPQSAASRMRTWVGRNSAGGTPYLYLTQSGNLTARDWVFSWYAKKHPTDATRFLAGCVMIEREAYPLATSPVFTAATSGTRDASAATLARAYGAATARLIYNNGDVVDLSFTGDTLALPYAAMNWGVRYIKTIEYRG